MTVSRILGVSFHAMTEEEAFSLFMGHLDDAGAACKVVVTPNPEAVMRTRRDAAFAEAVHGADYRLADGTGIVLASKLTHTPIPNRLRGYDTAMKLFEEIAKRGRKTTVYFLGGAPGVAEQAARAMAARYAPLTAVGFHDGYFCEKDEILIKEEIERLKPEILILGMGMPKQEIFALRHKSLPVKLIFCLGGSIDIMSGNVRLSPPVFRKLGLEWLHRLARQPSRLKRQMVLPRFAFLALWRFVNPFRSVEEK